MDPSESPPSSAPPTPVHRRLWNQPEVETVNYDSDDDTPPPLGRRAADSDNESSDDEDGEGRPHTNRQPPKPPPDTPDEFQTPPRLHPKPPRVQTPTSPTELPDDSPNPAPTRWSKARKDRTNRRTALDNNPTKATASTPKQVKRPASATPPQTPSTRHQVKRRGNTTPQKVVTQTKPRTRKHKLRQPRVTEPAEYPGGINMTKEELFAALTLD